MRQDSTILASVLFVTRAGGEARAAVVTRNAILRAGPSRSWPIKEKLSRGDELLLVDAAQKNGYYEVRAADGEPGWVWGRHVRIVDVPTDPRSEPDDASLMAYVVNVKKGPKELQGHWVRFAGRPFWEIEYVQHTGEAPCSFLMNSR